MRALIFDGRLQLRSDYPLPAVPPGEALIRTHLAGICNTDLEIMRGYMDFRGVLGHEFVGEVVQVEGAPELVGRRVVGEINAFCGVCPTCRRGDVTHCPQRTTLGIRGRDGTMADYFTLPIPALHTVPETVPDEWAVFTEPLAAALEITERLHIRPTQRVVVLGDGKLGLLIAQVLQLTGCDLAVVGRYAHKLAILARRGIRTHPVDDPPLPGADVVVEATGRAEGFALARRLLRPRGTLVLKSTFHGHAEIDTSALVVDELHVLGSRCGPFAPALRLLEQQLINVAALIEHVYPLDEGLVAFAHAARPGALKILLAAGEAASRLKLSAGAPAG
ncbi:MAG: alcohol dehydrogenase catalytic domain-containing protein [Anaerolineae bacterium]|nr:alcohol dehydrogenase catalytic domain-containing protein [Anaerolineae bacterium]MDW8069835.1 alcohol dehydrogenase catalytic domain-containing protein [Anaerolineae bacterium]